MNSNYNTCSLPVIFQDEIDVEDEPIEDSVDTIFNDSSINSDLQEHTLNTENVVWVSICIRIQYRVSTQI